ncbi:MAG: prolipoprotein diacylglyceryl transferase [Patescibacteria group bacterium]
MFGWLTSAPPNPILLTLGAVQLRWYGVSLALALLAGVMLAQHLAKRVGIARERIVDLALVATICAIVGARLVHVLNDWTYYRMHLADIPQLWKGGLAFHGVLLGGLLAAWLYARWKRLNVVLLADVLFPALALGQVIGRWGNWFNQELYGRPTNVAWAIPIDPLHRLAGYEALTRFHPLFLYEMLGNAVILGLLLYLWHRPVRQDGASGRPTRRTGDVAAAYLILSPSLRFGLDFLRLEQPMIGPVTNAQIFSILLILAGLALAFTRSRRPLH